MDAWSGIRSVYILYTKINHKFFIMTSMCLTPSSDFVCLNFHSNERGIYSLSIYDSLGNESYFALIAVVVGQNNFRLSFIHLPKSKYKVKITSPNEEIITGELFVA